MSFPRYPEYKESGVPWLGAVPSHWALHQTKRHFQRRKELNVGMACEHRLALTMNGVVPRSLDDLDGLQSSDYEGYQLFEAGDLAFKLIDLQNIKTSRVGLVPERGIMSPAYIRLQPLNTTDKRFAYWYFMALYWTQVFNSLGGGVRQTLGPEELLTVEYPVPPRSEQSAIAAFLDRETAKIDALVAEQEKLITLLKEKRQAVISQAVTKGLDPTVQMRDSGVEWLGAVPAHWEVRRIASVSTKITNGYVGPTRDILVEGGVRYLQSLHIKDNRIDFHQPYFVTEEWSQTHQKSILKRGDVLIVQTGDIGQVAVVPPEFDGCNCHALIIVSPLQSALTGEWLAGVLDSDYGLHSLVAIQTGALHPHLNCGNVRDIYVPVPPLTEQCAILDVLMTRRIEFDRLISEAQTLIGLLQERRSALISAAVTGQIDVRNNH